MNKIIILDRDGVINFDSPLYIKSPQEWKPIPKSLKAIAILNQMNFKVIVATNQSGIAHGYYSTYILNLIHQKMNTMLSRLGGEIDKIYYCPHSDDDQCQCRKPKSGLLEKILYEYNISNKLPIPMVGDSLRDLEAYNKANGTPILVRTGNGIKTEQTLPEKLKKVAIFNDLFSALPYISAL